MTEQLKKRSYKSFGRDFISSALFWAPVYRKQN